MQAAINKQVDIYHVGLSCNFEKEKANKNELTK